MKTFFIIIIIFIFGNVYIFARVFVMVLSTLFSILTIGIEGMEVVNYGLDACGLDY